MRLLLKFTLTLRKFNFVAGISDETLYKLFESPSYLKVKKKKIKKEGMRD